MPSHFSSPWIIRPVTPEEVYTDRQEFLDYLFEAALKAGTRRTMSTVLLGPRRMGKTEIFKRVVNRLFFEQDPADPQSVVPVFFSFPDEVVSRQDFALTYTENFVRWYVAFRERNPDLLRQTRDPEKLLALAHQSPVISETFKKSALDLLEAIPSGRVILPEEKALMLPRDVSDREDSTVVMFLDEFQNTHLPDYQFRVVGFMQLAVESPTCPHFVTGSAMSILAREIIGRGALFGRFRGKDIAPLSDYWGAELALRAARYYGADVPELMAPVLAARCGNNPFYITAVVQQAVESHTALTDEERINEILAVDISSGFIWGELHDQISRWIKRINEYSITKWILYLSALEEEDTIHIDRIQQELKRREGTDVPLETIREILVKLSRGDLIDYLELGGWFRKVKDPILLEFLKVWGKIEVEGRNQNQVHDALIDRYQKLERRIHEYKGYVAEIHMSQILLNSQHKTLPGRVFHSDDDIVMPRRFSYVQHRMRLGAGKGNEIDLLGAAGSEVWVCQSKWVTRDAIGRKVLEDLLVQAEMVKQERAPLILRMWLFAYNGLTKDARQFAHTNGILWSSKEELNELLRLLGLRELPEFDAEH